MSRRLNTFPDPEPAVVAAWSDGAGPATETGWTAYRCTLVTPLYGGGVTAGQVDREMPIRTASLRGQLRFWWRIACGPVQDSQAMFKRECAIWGGIGDKGPTASRVKIRVRNVSPVEVKPAFRYPPDPNAPGKLKSFPFVESWAEGYAVFSAQGKLTKNRMGFEEAPKELAQKGVSFEILLALSAALSDQQRAEVETALRWWASFGGIGARTRRGLGAVQVTGLTPVAAAEVESHGGQLVLRPSSGDATAAWKAGVARLKDFRQGLEVGRNPPTPPSRSPAGRSLWPEADTLRTLSGAADPRHAKRLVTVDAFPRAAFGLPIVFHFNTYTDPGDPGDHVLEPADISPDDKRDRLASPLIIRPYWTGTRWQPMALLLPGWEARISQPLKLKGKAYGAPHWPADTGPRHTMAAAVGPLNGRGDDALSAFMQFFREV